ncbi:YbaB/EbfC family nucleoid-associated protein [Nocardia neocaledoniensis]|uniref:YbaB/EbfC family nucleoid-associated protein n=1 Tax=Nocardia neocaledoniensis TaxID=236511 RepID=UPI0033E17238
MIEEPRRLARRVRALNEATDNARGSAYSQDGTVFLEVNTLGAITSIWLADHANERGMDVLADLIIATHQKARKAAMAEGQRIYDRFVAEGSAGGLK